MAIAFEMAKVATTVYLINNLRFRLVPILLSVALVCLVGISSIGIYGYLGKAYNEGRAEAVEPHRVRRRPAYLSGTGSGSVAFRRQ